MLYFMNELEKRRKDLLIQTRHLYNEKYTPPAIHPRYRTTYHALYDSKGEVKRKKLWLRIIVILLMLLMIYIVYQQGVKTGNINYEAIIDTIKNDLFGEILPLFIERIKFI